MSFSRCCHVEYKQYLVYIESNTYGLNKTTSFHVIIIKLNLQHTLLRFYFAGHIMGREVGFLSFSLLVLVGLSFDMVGVHVVEAANGLLPPADPPLRRQYYKKLNTCENVEAFVQFQVKQFWKKDKSITAKFLKLLYTDCMVTVSSPSIFFCSLYCTNLIKCIYLLYA